MGGFAASSLARHLLLAGSSAAHRIAAGLAEVCVWREGERERRAAGRARAFAGSVRFAASGRSVQKARPCPDALIDCDRSTLVRCDGMAASTHTTTRTGTAARLLLVGYMFGRLRGLPPLLSPVIPSLRCCLRFPSFASWARQGPQHTSMSRWIVVAPAGNRGRRRLHIPGVGCCGVRPWWSQGWRRR